MQVKYYLILFLTGISLHAFPQVAEWSTPQKPKNKTAYVRILGYNEEGFFLHRSGSRNFSKKPFIEYYRSSLGLEYTQPLPRIMKRSVVEKIMLWGNYIYAFYSRPDMKSGTTDLFMQKFDIELNPKGPYVKVTSAETGTGDFGPDFRIVHSRDKTRIWCFHAGVAGKDKLKLYFTSLSEQMLPLYTKEFELPAQSPELKFSGVLADDIGNILLLAKKPLVSTGEENSRSRYTVIRCNTDKNQLSSIILDSAENRLNDVEMAINYLSQELIVTGIYSDQPVPGSGNGNGITGPLKANNAATGYVFCRLNIDSFILNNCIFHKFDKSLISENVGEQAAEKGKELSDLTIRRIIPRSDAGVIMIVENFYVTQQSYSYVNNGIPQTQMRNQYNYDNIMLISINPDGTPEWKHVIKKNQVALNDEDYYSSFVTMVTPDSIHILFNEKTSGGDVLHYSVHNSGSIDHKILFKSINTYVFLMPAEAKQISNNVMLLATIKDRKFCLLKLIF